MDRPRRPDPRRRFRRNAAAACALVLLVAVTFGVSRIGRADDVHSQYLTTPAVPTVGLDSAGLADLAQAASGLPRLRALIVARHGVPQLEQHVRGPGLDVPVNVKSVSKSVLSAVLGIAIADGYIEGVDQPVLPWFERHVAEHEDPRRAGITIGHLLSMQSGLEPTSGSRYGRWVASPHWVRYAITRPMTAEPGTARQYSTGNSHLLSAILTQATGRSTWSYARDRLAAPLGITLPPWPTDPQGIFFGGNDMLLSPRALLRFGELYRNDGRLDGRQIVPEEWVRASLSPRSRVGWNGEGYGYGWFLSSVHGYRMFYAWGYGGQFVFIVPQLELTVVVTSDAGPDQDPSHFSDVRRLLTRWIVPAAVAGAAPAAAVDNP